MLTCRRVKNPISPIFHKKKRFPFPLANASVCQSIATESMGRCVPTCCFRLSIVRKTSDNPGLIFLPLIL